MLYVYIVPEVTYKVRNSIAVAECRIVEMQSLRI
jgi:hypothetical protein